MLMLNKYIVVIVVSRWLGNTNQVIPWKSLDTRFPTAMQVDHLEKFLPDEVGTKLINHKYLGRGQSLPHFVK